MLGRFVPCGISPIVGLGVPLQDAKGDLPKPGFPPSNFPASKGKKINTGGFFDCAEGKLNSGPQTDPKPWDLGAGSKPGCRLEQTLLMQCPAQMLVDGRWLNWCRGLLCFSTSACLGGAASLSASRPARKRWIRFDHLNPACLQRLSRAQGKRNPPRLWVCVCFPRPPSEIPWQR